MTAQEQKTILTELDKYYKALQEAPTSEKGAQEYVYTGAISLAIELLRTADPTKKIYRHNGKHSIINKQ